MCPQQHLTEQPACLPAVSGGQLLLPHGVTTADLDLIKVERCSHIKDPDPDIENEFFETRQVSGRASGLGGE